MLSGGLRAALHADLPEGPPRAAVLLVHGYAEYSGRYDAPARRLAERGYVAYRYDQRGHGRTPGVRGYVRRFELLADDLEAAFRQARALRPELPLFLYGHSMGGAVCLTCLLRHPELGAAGLLLSSPHIRLSSGVSPFLQRISALASRLIPYAPTVRLDRATLSHDAGVAARYERDPLCYTGRVRARTGAELVRIAGVLQTRLAEVRLPFLVFHGSADRLTAPEGSRLLYEQAASPDKTLRLFEGRYHETLNEEGSDEVYAAFLDWLDARAPAPGATEART